MPNPDMRRKGKEWDALGDDVREQAARRLCVADGNNPDLIVHVEAMPLERAYSPDGVVLIHREYDWAPLWRRYLRAAERFYHAGLLRTPEISAKLNALRAGETVEFSTSEVVTGPGDSDAQS